MNIDFARAVFGQEEIKAVNRVLQGTWLASASENEAFEREFSSYVGVKYGICVNSGSSANLLALASLELPKLSKVITSACGFPATLSPVLHLGLKPVLVDYDLKTHNIDIEAVKREILADVNHEIKAIIFAHTLGSPVPYLREICEISKRRGVTVIEDCCEAAGTFVEGKPVGSFGELATFSFYPSHQITAGGMGGMVVTNDSYYMTRMKSMRDWGKVWYWNEKLQDNKTRYTEDLQLPYLYYRHYCYDTVGFNFKLAEMNAAFGREQLKKLNKFSRLREKNFHLLRDGLRDLDDFIQIKYDGMTSISWFGYPLTIRDGSKLDRNRFGEYLESVGIRHRPFFAGNILWHRPFFHLFAELGFHAYDHPFPVADKLMKDSLFIGCHTEIKKEEISYIIKKIHEYVISINSESKVFFSDSSGILNTA